MALVPPKERKWIAYNHMPGGQIVVQKFDTVTKRKILGGDKTQDFIITADAQIKGFEESDFVALHVGGKLVKNKVLIYDGPSIPWDDPRAADRVIEWAKKKGIEPRKMESEKEAEKKLLSPRAIEVESRISALESGFTAVSSKIDELIALISGGKK